MKSLDDQLTDIVLLPVDVIAEIPSLRDAYRKCVETSRYSEAEVADELGIEPAQFSRVLKRAGRHLDDDQLSNMERFCGNKIPTQWLAFQDGFELKRIESVVEKENRELRARIHRMQGELSSIASILRRDGVEA